MSDRTTSPQWNEAFCFPVRDPTEDVLVVKVRCTQFMVTLEHAGPRSMRGKYASTLFTAVLQLSHNWALPVGSLVVPVKQLLSEPGLILDQWLNLDGASPESQVLLRAELKVLPFFFNFTTFGFFLFHLSEYLSLFDSSFPLVT